MATLTLGTTLQHLCWQCWAGFAKFSLIVENRKKSSGFSFLPKNRRKKTTALKQVQCGGKKESSNEA